MNNNFLDKIPTLHSSLAFTVSDEGVVTLQIENKGFMNRLMQKLFKKPKISYVHLDSQGSFAVICADGKRSIFEIGKLVDEKFGEASHPLYERLVKFFQIMDSYNFIEWK